jgi:hypothetical protein
MKEIKYIILYLAPVPKPYLLNVPIPTIRFRNTDYLDNILENLEAKMPHKLRVVEGGEEKSALAAKRRLFLRIIKRKTFKYRFTGAGTARIYYSTAWSSTFSRFCTVVPVKAWVKVHIIRTCTSFFFPKNLN